VRTHCVGFDDTQMPPGHERAESYRDYILGVRDGQPKTPAWAEGLLQVALDDHGVPRPHDVEITR
jgi:hypothetical protein